jgi:hypothetical protein
VGFVDLLQHPVLRQYAGGAFVSTDVDDVRGSLEPAENSVQGV